jgi:hypothetical protein
VWPEAEGPLWHIMAQAIPKKDPAQLLNPNQSAARALEPSAIPHVHRRVPRPEPTVPAPRHRLRLWALAIVRRPLGPRPRAAPARRGYGSPATVRPSGERPRARAAERASSSAPPPAVRSGSDRASPPTPRLRCSLLRRSARRPPSARAWSLGPSRSATLARRPPFARRPEKASRSSSAPQPAVRSAEARAVAPVPPFAGRAAVRLSLSLRPPSCCAFRLHRPPSRSVRERDTPTAELPPSAESYLNFFRSSATVCGLISWELREQSGGERWSSGCVARGHGRFGLQSNPRLATGGPGHILLMAGFLREEDTTVLWDVQV